MALLGKEIRLSRLMPEDDGLYLGLTVDHSMARGVLSGLDTIEATLEKIVAGGPDAITMHKGIAANCFSTYAGKAALVLKCTTFAPYHPDYDAVVSRVEEGVRMGADAVSVGCILGGDNQAEQVSTLGEFSRAAEEFGMPLVSHIYPRGNQIAPEERTSWRNVLYAARTAAELGVDLIKTYYTGDPDSFAKVVQGTPARVLIAGGSSEKSIEEYLRMTRDVIDAGAKGVTYGRFVFGYKNPTALVKTLRAVIHKGVSVRDALEYLRELEEKDSDRGTP